MIVQICESKNALYTVFEYHENKGFNCIVSITKKIKAKNCKQQ